MNIRIGFIGFVEFIELLGSLGESLAVKITRFEDNEAWQEARRLVNLVYEAINWN